MFKINVLSHINFLNLIKCVLYEHCNKKVLQVMQTRKQKVVDTVTLWYS